MRVSGAFILGCAVVTEGACVSGSDDQACINDQASALDLMQLRATSAQNDEDVGNDDSVAASLAEDFAFDYSNVTEHGELWADEEFRRAFQATPAVHIKENAVTNLCLGLADDLVNFRGANVIMTECTEDGANKWKFVVRPDGAPIVVNQRCGMCLDVAGGSMSRGANVIAWPCHYGLNQQWTWFCDGEGRIGDKVVKKGSMADKKGGNCMDIAGGDRNSGEGTNVIVWSCHGGWNQKWSRVPGEPQPYEVPIQEAAVTRAPNPVCSLPANRDIALRSAHNKYVVAESNGEANANRGAIGGWEKFRAIRQADGKYAFRSTHGKHLVCEKDGRARFNRQWIRDWEKFELKCDPDGKIGLKGHHNKWIVAESDGRLNCNRAAKSTWETFQVLPQ